MSTSKRTFYRTIIQVEVLSETPYNETDLEQVSDDIINGAQSGRITIITENEEMDAKTCVKKLKEQGSDPEFFFLDEHGNDSELDVEDEDEDDGLYSQGPKKIKRDH